MAELSNKIRTGFALDATEGVLTTLAAANFIHDAEVEQIQIKAESNAIYNPGRHGATKVAKGKVSSTIGNLEIPVTSRQEFPILIAAGLTSAAGGIYLGTPTSAGANAGRTSVSTMTFEQYTGNEKIILSATKPATASIYGKYGEPVKLKGSFQGVANITAQTGYPYDAKSTTNPVNPLLASSLSISGISLSYSEFELDFGLNFVAGSDATTTHGALRFGEITDYKPKFTVNPLATAQTVAFRTAMVNATTVPVSLSFGSGAGNTYTITFDAYMESAENADQDSLSVKKIVMVPVFKEATGKLIDISVA
jgi:hypothetical protein